jgi:hypothetical protein
LNATIYTLKQQKAEIMQRLWAFNRRFKHYEPTPEELAGFDRDIRAVRALNAAIEREDAARRPLTRADIQAEIDSILRQERDSTPRSREPSR